MKTKKQHFTFYFEAYGHYSVYYTSPVTYKSWKKLVTDMTIIDATKNCEYPKLKDLDTLKRICKSGKQVDF